MGWGGSGEALPVHTHTRAHTHIPYTHAHTHARTRAHLHTHTERERERERWEEAHLHHGRHTHTGLTLANYVCVTVCVLQFCNSQRMREGGRRRKRTCTMGGTHTLTALTGCSDLASLGWPNRMRRRRILSSRSQRSNASSRGCWEAEGRGHPAPPASWASAPGRLDRMTCTAKKCKNTHTFPLCNADGAVADVAKAPARVHRCAQHTTVCPCVPGLAHAPTCVSEHHWFHTGGNSSWATCRCVEEHSVHVLVANYTVIAPLCFLCANPFAGERSVYVMVANYAILAPPPVS